MYAKFFKLTKLVRTILLVIPFCNWIVEIVIRWDRFLSKQTLENLLLAIVFTFGGLLLGYADLVYNIVKDKLLFVE